MSDKPVTQKLLIKENCKALIVNEPEDYRSTLGELPQNATLLSMSTEPVDLVQVFVTSSQELEARLPGLKKALKPKGILWVTYPKGTSKTKANINRDSIREYARSIGLEAIAMVSVDETWSALRLKAI
ncbi:MAG: DUF3052 family protein [Chloroflexi bacterium]|nr:DUF3052 family protein [Chloroflexota bacterium]